MNILNKYILRKFLITFLFVVGIMILVVTVIDFTEKNDKFINKDLQIKNLIISKQTAPEGWVEVVKLALEKIK